jgi:hypothetical protein
MMSPSCAAAVAIACVTIACGSLGCGSGLLGSKRCDFQNPEYTAKVATCRLRIEQECDLNPDNTPVATCPELIKCEAWRKEQCQ